MNGFADDDAHSLPHHCPDGTASFRGVLKDLIMNRMQLMIVGALFVLANTASAENWPSWRGPRGDGTSQEKNLPTKWSATDNIAWKTPLPGIGHASPIVWGNRIFTVTALPKSQERVLLCLDRQTGSILWQKTALQAPLENKNGENSYASSTPSTDGERVYVSFLENTNVFASAFDFTGKQLWQVRPGTFKSEWGFCSPPQIFEDKIILSCDSKGENFLVALSGTDGRTLWKTQREKPSQSYGTPLIAKMSGRNQIVLGGNSTISSYNPKDGSLLWFANGPASDYVASPAYNERAGLVLADTSWPKRVLMAVKPDGNGDVSNVKVAWSTPEGAPYVPSPVAVGDYFLTSSFNKDAYCFEAATGKVLWHETLGLHHASPVVADGLVYFLNDDGIMHVLKAGLAFELVARNELGERTFASPAISQGQIFLRSFENLYCIGLPTK